MKNPQNAAGNSNRKNAAQPEKDETKPDENPHCHAHFSVTDLQRKLEAVETFIARRFDEISMEINATSQQVDMAEEGIINRFTEILEVLSAISYHGDGTSPANAGVELDAVVDMTEDAANTILDAAARISTLAKDPSQWKETKKRERALAAIERDVDTVIMACSFQDITGQRIRKTLENLKMIEERLSGTLSKLGISITVHPEDQCPVAASQNEIDALFRTEHEQKSTGN